MKVVILAGGLGTRFAEETELRPKPMIEIGGKPILWHIIRHYAHYGFEDFLIALGYKGEVIKKYFVDYFPLSGDLSVSLATGQVESRNNGHLNINLELIDTGVRTQTGGRVRRLKPHLSNETFMMTWGDGVSNIDLRKLLAYHRSHGKLATVTVVHPPSRFGHVVLSGDQVTEFTEKPQAAEGWINGAFFVLEPQVLDYIEDDATHWERGPMERLAREGQLMAYRHESFWQCMDTLRDKNLLQQLWETDPPWRVWDERKTS
ncbi:MAG: glucose-1-phosphate cytidylyltransferase [Bryobacteraceae bacterium]